MKIGDKLEVVQTPASRSHRALRLILQVREIRAPPSYATDTSCEKCILTVYEYRSVDDFVQPVAKVADDDEVSFAPLSRGAEVLWCCPLETRDRETEIKVKDIRQIVAIHEGEIILEDETDQSLFLCRYVWLMDKMLSWHEVFLPVFLYLNTGSTTSLPERPSCNDLGIPIVGDLFSGVGGFSCGFSAAGF